MILGSQCEGIEDRPPERARALIGAGESPRDPRLDPCELAAYTATAQLILNLDETINKE